MKPVKRIVAVQDISGYGKASLTVALPILSTMGIQVCPLTTAVLSSISEFPHARMIDLTQFMKDVLDHWKSLNLKFDAVYSGFLGSPQQVQIVQTLISQSTSEDSLIVIDPVMGDNGKLYSVFTDEIIKSMKKLIRIAQVITPNLTEAAFLLGEPIDKVIDQITIIGWLQRLSDLGPAKVIITSVPDYDDESKTCAFAYDRDSNEFWKMSCKYIPGGFPGTGDTFTSVVTGCLLHDQPFNYAIEKAAIFVYKAIEFSLDYISDRRQGIYMEPLLSDLSAPIKKQIIQKLDIIK